MEIKSVKEILAILKLQFGQDCLSITIQIKLFSTDKYD